jgi:hypothetical protein
MFVEFLGWSEDFDNLYPVMEYISLGDLEYNLSA